MVPERMWLEHEPQPSPLPAHEPRIPLGQWLVENMPRGTNLELPDRRDSDRPIPFADWDEDEWTDEADGGA
ncbi:MAG: hypothetical protein F4X26_09390 [Chloroflexi bacterium]|nr:hypothetical protein [Chloroflexota bacterium]